ncbi:hypothetical protein JOD54_000883 [Actinokineospora baliensis]|uniref:hypothetical protein n=1 Tax=Actinokineospora baliensis TaxID=547056 RepID=UPI00195DB794|nr:hypothetical protein [Actinokineospora baliensis]MBM7770679.1 hypothetical protein [Actinokineospora baliensis]
MADIEYRFGTGDSAPNVHHGEANVDVDGDGTNDAIAVDFDGDGRYDDSMWDSDGDGVADTALLDYNDDGVAESAYNDPTGLGTWNEKGIGGDESGDLPPAHPTTSDQTQDVPSDTTPATDTPADDQTQDVPSDVPEDDGADLPPAHPTGDEQIEDGGFENQPGDDDTAIDHEPHDDGTLDESGMDDSYDSCSPDSSSEATLSDWYSELS